MPAQLTLRQLIQQATDQFAPADASSRYFMAALHHAQAFRRELLVDAARELKTAYLSLGADRTVDLPADYVEYTMLGLLLPGWGGVRNLVYNERAGRQLPPLLTAQTPPPSYLQAPVTYECEQARYGLLDAGYEGYCGFGVPCWGAEFRIDRSEGRIIAGSLLGEEAILVLEYLAFDAANGEDIAIDPLAHSWGLEYILERLHAQKKNWPAVQYHKGEAEKERLKYKARVRTLSPEGILQAKRLAAGQGWK